MKVTSEGNNTMKNPEAQLIGARKPNGKRASTVFNCVNEKSFIKAKETIWALEEYAGYKRTKKFTVKPWEGTNA